jgi:hypothetical protein
MIRFTRALLALVALGVGAGSCKDSSAPKGPTAGALDVTLTMPNADDGAILFVVSGGAVDSITAPSGTFQLMSSGAATKAVLVRGTLTSGVIARVWVADVSVSYTVALQQVAARTTYAQRALAGYSLVIAP